MDNEQFCYWLHGYFEIGDIKKTTPFLNAAQIDIVRDHINLVEEENPWTCGFIQWLQGVIDTTGILTLKNTDYVDISRAIAYQLTELFDKKTPPFDNNKLQDSTENPEVIFPQLTFPPHPIIPQEDLICSMDNKSILDCAIDEPDLEEVLDNFSPPLSYPIPQLKPKVYCYSKKVC